jgi:hypothetical protein
MWVYCSSSFLSDELQYFSKLKTDAVADHLRLNTVVVHYLNTTWSQRISGTELLGE